MKKYILKSNSLGVVSLPPEIWNKTKWDINEPLEVIVCENFNSKDDKWLSVSIDAVKDRDNFDDILETNEIYETTLVRKDIVEGDSDD